MGLAKSGISLVNLLFVSIKRVLSQDGIFRRPWQGRLWVHQDHALLVDARAPRQRTICFFNGRPHARQAFLSRASAFHELYKSKRPVAARAVDDDRADRLAARDGEF